MLIRSMAINILLTLQDIFNLLNCGRSRSNFLLLIIVCALTLIPIYVDAATCLASASSNTASIVTQGTFSTANSKYTYGVKIGPVSSSLYYFYYLYKSNPIYTSVVRKEYQNGTQAWMTAVLFKPIEKSLSVDALEQNVYFASLTTPSVNVVRLLATDGSIVSTQVHTNIDGNSDDIKVHTMSDNSGYFIISFLASTNFLNICKYLFSSSATSQCQEIVSIYQYAYGQLKIADGQFYFVGLDPTFPFPLHLNKITFGNSAADWSYKMACWSGSCSASESDSVLNSDGSKIYSVFSYGPSSSMFFVTLNLADGTIQGNRYKSVIGCNYVGGVVLDETYLAMTALCSNQYLILF